MNNERTFLEAQRLADEKVYLSEERYENPKEYFKVVTSMFSDSLGDGNDRRLLDVGCATGEYIYWL